MDEVTAVATVVVAGATVIYAWLTWHIADEARASSEAAEAAAKSAAASAKAAVQSVEVQQAAIVVDFRNRLIFSSTANRAWLAIEAVQANIYLVGLEGVVIIQRNDGSYESDRYRCYGPDGDPMQHLAGASHQFDWFEPRVTPTPEDRQRTGAATIHYRLATEGATRTAFVNAPVEVHPPFD